jgi:pyruvate kinase
MLAMVWGVTAVTGQQLGLVEERYEGAMEALRDNGLLKDGDRVILTGGSLSATPGSTNALRLHTIGEGRE